MQKRICKNCGHRKDGHCHATGLKVDKEIRSFDYYQLLRKRFACTRGDRCLVPERFRGKEVRK